MIGTAGSASHIGGQWWLFFSAIRVRTGIEEPSRLGGQSKEEKSQSLNFVNTRTNYSGLSVFDKRPVPSGGVDRTAAKLL